jgi:hypothetical protein
MSSNLLLFMCAYEWTFGEVTFLLCRTNRHMGVPQDDPPFLASRRIEAWRQQPNPGPTGGEDVAEARA